MKIWINTAPEQRLCNFIVAVVFSVFLTNMAAGLSQIIGIEPTTITNVLKVILAFLFISRIKILIQRFNRHLLAFIGCTGLVVIINYIMYPQLDVFFNNTVLTFFSFCMTTYLIYYSISDYDLLIRELTKISYLMALVLIIFLTEIFLGHISSFNEDHYSMGLGYSCIIPAIMLSLDFIKNRKFISLLGVIIFIVTIIMFGSRGPLIELFLFITFFAIKYLIQNKKYLQCVITVVTIFALILTYKDLLLYFASLLESRGMVSRVIRTLTTDDIHMSGRDILYNQLITHIETNPFSIRGINAEWAVIGVYAHNIVIELFYQLGILLGGIILVFVIFRIGKTLLLPELDSEKMLCIIFMCASIPQLLVSGSLWTHYIFWLWMASCSKMKRRINST